MTKSSMACNTLTCQLDGKIDPVAPDGLRIAPRPATACVGCGQRECRCAPRRIDRTGRRGSGTRARGDLVPVTPPTPPVPSVLNAPDPPLVTGSTQGALRPPVSTPALPVRPPPLGGSTAASRPSDAPTSFTVQVRQPAPGAMGVPQRAAPTAPTDALPSHPLRPIFTPGYAPEAQRTNLTTVAPSLELPMTGGGPDYCNDPRFRDSELCQRRADGSAPPALSDYCKGRLLALGSVDLLRQDELCAGAFVPTPANVQPSGAVDTPDACVARFLSFPLAQQAHLMEDGLLGRYAMSQSAAMDLRHGVASAAQAWSDWMRRTFAPQSPEMQELCTAVVAYERSYPAPAGAVDVLHVPDGIYIQPLRRDLGAGVAPAGRAGHGGGGGARPDGGYRTWGSNGDGWGGDGSGDLSTGACIEFLATVPPRSFAEAMASVRVGGHGFVDDAYSREVYKALLVGVDRRAEYLARLRASLTAFDLRDPSRAALLRAALLELCRAAEARIGYAPAGAPSGAILDDASARALFPRLPPTAQVAVLRGIAFPGAAYPSSLAVAVERGMSTVDGFPVYALLFGWMDNEFRAGDPHRTLFNYDVSTAARRAGLLTNASGDADMSFGEEEVDVQNQQAALLAQGAGNPPADFLSSAGLTAAQWTQLVTRNPAVATRMWTEYRARPSTFAQVSQTLLQAADRVLTGIHQSATDDLAAQNATAAHQQAMARIALEREQARAQRAQAQAGLLSGLAPPPAPAPQTTTLAVTTPATPVPATPVPATPPPVDAQSESMSTGKVAVIGLAAVAALGTAGYFALRKRPKSNSEAARRKNRKRRATRAAEAR